MVQMHGNIPYLCNSCGIYYIQLYNSVQQWKDGREWWGILDSNELRHLRIVDIVCIQEECIVKMTKNHIPTTVLVEQQLPM